MHLRPKPCHDTAEAVRVAFEFFSQRAALGFAIPEWLPTPNNLQYHAAVSQLDSAVYGIIEDRKQQLSALQAPSQHNQVGNSSCSRMHLELSALQCMSYGALHIWPWVCDSTLCILPNTTPSLVRNSTYHAKYESILYLTLYI